MGRLLAIALCVAGAFAFVPAPRAGTGRAAVRRTVLVVATETRAYNRIDGDGDAGNAVDEAAIVALIDARGLAKHAKEYETADAISLQLRTEHAVVLDDKGRTWRIVLQSGGYYRVGPKVDPVTTKQVGDMLERRSAHQVLKEYEQADAIHAQLTGMGIVLDTRIKSWKQPGEKGTRGQARQDVSGQSRSIGKRDSWEQ
eukprot:6426436-Prymnesium_polylepis.1